jgi:uncharacterized protein (TIGR02001 family)
MRLGGYALAAMVAAVMAVKASLALAQLSSSLSVDSDYRYRGVTLSRDRPAVRLNLAYDRSGGAYGGVSVIGMRDDQYGDLDLSYVGYTGYVWQPAQGPAWEAGVSATHIRDGSTYNYAEIYGGLITQNFTARVYYSPHYYGSRMHTLYSEFSTAKRLSPNLRAFLHAGMLTPLSGVHRHERYDVRAGLAVSLSHYEIQAAWSKTNPLSGYISHHAGDGDALILSASCFF